MAEMQEYLVATDVKKLRDLLAEGNVEHYILDNLLERPEYSDYDFLAEGQVIPVYLSNDPDIFIDRITPEELLAKIPSPSPELKHLLSLMDEEEDLVIIDWGTPIITTERIYEEFKERNGWTFYVVAHGTTDEAGLKVFKPLDGQLFKSWKEAEEAALRWLESRASVESWTPEERIIAALQAIYQAKVVLCRAKRASRRKFRQYILDGDYSGYSFPGTEDGTIVEVDLWEDPDFHIQSLGIWASYHPELSRLLDFLYSEEGEKWRDWEVVYYERAPEVLVVPPGAIDNEDLIFYAVSYQEEPLGGELFDTEKEARKAWREFLKELKKQSKEEEEMEIVVDHLNAP